jgi:hypothetical protein
MTSAYDALSPQMKQYLDGLSAWHDMNSPMTAALQHGICTHERYVEVVAQNRRQLHPMVRVHPLTGRKALYVSPTYVTHIDGLPQAESHAILAYLHAHCMRCGVPVQAPLGAGRYGDLGQPQRGAQRHHGLRPAPAPHAPCIGVCTPGRCRPEAPRTGGRMRHDGINQELLSRYAPRPGRKLLLPALSDRQQPPLCRVLSREGHNDHIAGHITLRLDDGSHLANP